MKILNLNKVKRDGLVVIGQSLKHIPFNIKRFYYIKNIKKNKWRGFHAHKKNKQIIICLSGKFEFIIINKLKKRRFKLNQDQCIFLSKKTWREFRPLISKSILLVLNSEKYSFKDYIFDKKVFLKI